MSVAEADLILGEANKELLENFRFPAGEGEHFYFLSYAMRSDEADRPPNGYVNAVVILSTGLESAKEVFLKWNDAFRRTSLKLIFSRYCREIALEECAYPSVMMAPSRLSSAEERMPERT
jgi:hypothetical protein